MPKVKRVPRLRKAKVSAKPRPRSPLRIDPTRTQTLRRLFVGKLRRKFARLKAAIYKLLVQEDALGLKASSHDPFAYHPTSSTETYNCAPGQLRDGTTGRCGPGVGINLPRSKMPQIEAKDLLSFVHFVRAQGIVVSQETFRAADLRPVQREFRSERVHAIPEHAAREPIIVSSDNYILDGTHRWVKRWLWSRHAEVRAFRVALPVREALALMRRFPGAKLVSNTRWKFSSDPAKVMAFRGWLRKQLDIHIRGKSDEELWTRYVQQGLQRGAGRTFDDYSRRRGGDFGKSPDFYAGTKQEFLRSSFAQPVAIEKAQLLAQRSFTELEGVTDVMDKRMTRTLTDGLVEGKSPRQIAADLNRDVDGIGRARAETIARTELIRAHAEGQLLAMEKLGVKEVGVQVEWLTAGDDRVCPDCSDMEGSIFSIDDAKGMIPMHPGCRCAFIPVIPEDEDEEVKDAEDQEDEDVTENVFCPTGPGGGVDATCGKGGESPTAGEGKGLQPREVLEKLGAAGKWMKAQTQKLYVRLEARYGRKQALAIMAAGQAVGWGATAAGAAFGVPVWLPGSTLWGSLPFAALAEVHLQARKMLSRNRATKELTEEEIQREAERLVEEMKRLTEEAKRKFPESDPATQNAFCATGPGGGVDPTCGKDAAKETARASFAGKVVEQHVGEGSALANHKGLSSQQKTDYRRSFESVVQRMPFAAVETLHREGLEKVSWSPSPKEVTDLFQTFTKQDVSKAKVYGFYHHARGEAHLDGRLEDTEGKSADRIAMLGTREAIYAHELGHALDRGGRYSSSPAWKDAWEKDIKGGRLSRYATTNPSEGFAEFSRALYGSHPSVLPKLREKLPNCHRFFSELGFVPKES